MTEVEKTVNAVLDLRKHKCFNEAEALLRTAINTHPTSWELWNQLGHVLVANENYPEAASSFEKATELNPNGFWLWLSLGYARKEITQLDGAIDATLKATELSSSPNELGSALYNLGCYNCIAGRHVEALEYLEQAFHKDESIKEWARDDSDLQSLKENERFLNLLSQEKKKEIGRA
ncbi:MAG: tetratricopeptide repeat protein [Candidatus Thorarchaeota archaeon]